MNKKRVLLGLFLVIMGIIGAALFVLYYTCAGCKYSESDWARIYIELVIIITVIALGLATFRKL